MVRYCYFFVVAFVLLVNNVVVATASENATNATTIVENVTNATMIVPCYGDRSSGNCPPCTTVEDCRPHYNAEDLKKVTCYIHAKIAGNGTTSGCAWRVFGGGVLRPRLLMLSI